MKPDWLNRSIVCAPYYALCLSVNDFRAELKSMNCREFPEFVVEGASATTHLLKHKDRLCAIVCLEPSFAKDPIVVAGLLVHEAVHVWQRALEEMRETSEPGREIEAYSIQWISQQLMWEYVRQTKRRRK